MKFTTIKIAACQKAILAHTFRNNEKNLFIKKGTVLTKRHIASLKKAGVEKVIVARLAKTDITENKAANIIGRAMGRGGVVGGIVVGKGATGRVNLYAKYGGLFCVKKNSIDKLNKITPAITLATLPDDSVVKKNQLIATVKIIPFAVHKNLVARAVKVAKQNIVGVYKAKPYKVGLISTKLPSIKPSIIEKTKNVLQSRLNFWQSKIVVSENVCHDENSVSKILPNIIKKTELVILFGASAICDVNDIIPAAIKRCGGKIIYFGMPVDPGNLLLVAKLGDKFIIGAPGCARSKSHNGFDMVLARILCNAPINPQYISGLGVGGLLLETKARGQPREN